MARLLIDNSNNRTKLAIGKNTGLSDWRAVISTAELNSDTLKEILAGIRFDAVACASVVPQKAKMLSEFFDSSHAFHLLTHESPHDLGFDLDHPEQIGSDRLANAIAMRKTHGTPGIAVDFGTAVTFSVVSAEGNFSGGIIAPGMAAMTEYLSARTAQLPYIEPIEPAAAIGRTTIEAMHSGAVIGHRGMVREILREIISETEGKPKVIATGGGAAFSASKIPEIDLVDPNLTLEGLRLLAETVFDRN